MSNLMGGKTAIVLGVANKWSLAYAIAQAFVREGGNVVLTYQGDRQRETVEELAAARLGIQLNGHWRLRSAENVPLISLQPLAAQAMLAMLTH